MLIENMHKFKEELLKKIIINENGCWIFQGSKSQVYGEYRRLINGIKFTTAHRASYYLFKGNIPENTMVLHKCSDDHKKDNYKCINPDHLYLGSHKDNMRDKALSGIVAGENNPMYGKPGSRLGAVLSDSTKNKIKQKQIGSLNHMFGRRGNKNPNYGKKRPEITRVKISQNRKGKMMGNENPSSKSWKIISPSEEKFIIDNLPKFCIDYGINYKSFVTNRKWGKWKIEEQKEKDENKS